MTSQTLRSPVSRLTESVDPPLTVTLDGVPYVLSSTSQISQDHRDSSKSPKEVRHDFIIETTVDPEDGQELMVCQVCNLSPSRPISLSAGSMYKSLLSLG